MKRTLGRKRDWVAAVLALLAGGLGPTSATAQSSASSAVYRCPGPPVLYTDAISSQEARERGCKLLEGAPITVIPGPKPRPVAPGAAPASAPAGARSLPEAKIDVGAQRQRDRDSRRILEAELKREEDKLAALQKSFNGGEPERRGEERNFQAYLDRVAEMRASIARTEADIAALKRELSKLPQ